VNSVLIFLSAYLLGNVAGYSMQPIVEYPRKRGVVHKQSKKRPAVHKKKATPPPRNNQQVSPPLPPPPPINIQPEPEPRSKTEIQLEHVKNELIGLENKKRALLEEFAQKQAAFAAMLPSANENKPQQSILLAISSKSLDDFVHGAVMLNYVNACIMQRNQAYINLVKSIHNADVNIQNCKKTEIALVGSSG
jgi:hypothetical protein